MACLMILRRSRVGHPRVAIRSVVAVWRRWSFLINLAAQCCTFSRCLIWVVVCGFHIGEAYIQVLVGLACYRQFLLHQVCMVRGFV